MSAVLVELSFDQLLTAVRKLPWTQKSQLLDTLETELSREEIRRRATEAVAEIREAYKDVSEEEVMADVNTAVHEVRAERRARLRTLGDLARSEFFGLWRDRADITDSAEFARRLRVDGWSRAV